MLETWTGYIAMEVELGNINEARSIYKRCYSKRLSGTGSEVLMKLSFHCAQVSKLVIVFPFDFLDS